MEYLPTYILAVVLIAQLYFSYRDRQDATVERMELQEAHRAQLKEATDTHNLEKAALLDRLMAKDFEQFKDNETLEENSLDTPNETPEETDIEDAREEIELEQ
jgi:hypothetical protein